MVRFLNAYFPGRMLFLGFTEMLLVATAFIAATAIWAGSDTSLLLAYEGGFARIAIITAVFLLCMYYLDLYDNLVLTNRREVVTRLVQVAGTVTLILAGIYYVYPSARIGLAIFVTGIVFVLVGVAAWRFTFFWTCHSLNLYQRVLVLGDGTLARQVAHEISERPEAAIRVVGYSTPQGPGAADLGMSYLGELSTLRNVVHDHKIDRIVVALGDRRGHLPVEELLALKSEGIAVVDGADVYESLTGKVPVESLRLSWLLFSGGFQMSNAQLIYKRVFGIVVSTLLLIFTAPLMVLIAIAIRLDSSGPAIFRQERVGQRGKIFTLYKFRSMYMGSDGNGNHPAKADDERFTRVGKWLRRVRLDELPQLLNILKGDMSFVGPRPFVPEQESECSQHIPFYSQRWTVKPGATGWAQVNREYCATLEENREKLAYDLFYIKNISIGLDLLIIFKTLKTLLLGRGGR